MATLQDHDQGDNYPVWQATSRFGTLLAAGVALVAVAVIGAMVARWIGGGA